MEERRKKEEKEEEEEEEAPIALESDDRRGRGERFRECPEEERTAISGFGFLRPRTSVSNCDFSEMKIFYLKKELTKERPLNSNERKVSSIMYSRSGVGEEEKNG